jgi:hypothetical protein
VTPNGARFGAPFETFENGGEFRHELPAARQVDRIDVPP